MQLTALCPLHGTVICSGRAAVKVDTVSSGFGRPLGIHIGLEPGETPL